MEAFWVSIKLNAFVQTVQLYLYRYIYILNCILEYEFVVLPWKKILRKPVRDRKNSEIISAAVH